MQKPSMSISDMGSVAAEQPVAVKGDMTFADVKEEEKDIDMKLFEEL